MIIPYAERDFFRLSFLYNRLLFVIYFIYSSVYIGEGSGTPLQYSCLENPMDRGAWWAAVHGVTESWTRLSDFTFTFHLNALEKEMATHSSVLAWRIPEMGEPGGLPSMHLWPKHIFQIFWSQNTLPNVLVLSIDQRSENEE